VNKSLITNVLAAIVITVGYTLDNHMILNIGLFALSGAITNWLAIHMLFDKVPGLYGSGVIPRQFEEFKSGIKSMMMTQFFTTKNIDRFLRMPTGKNELQLAPIIEKVDFSPAFDALIQVIMASSFGKMLDMLGGETALVPLKEPFLKSMKETLIDISTEENFQKLLREELVQPELMTDIQQQIEDIVEQRLSELSPSLVKQMIQDMIRKHLGWLVVWGGVFGGLIGFISTFIL